MRSIVLIMLVAIATSEVVAQETSFTVAGGAFAFDLSGTGTAPMGAARLGRELGASFSVEVGLTIARPDQQFGETTTFLAPDLQLKWFPWRGVVAPYLGVGTGWVYDIRPSSRNRDDVSFSAAAGVRIPISSNRRSGLELEFRPRFIDTGFTGSSGDFTVGWFFGL